MAKTIKQLPKESRETQTPGGQPDVLDIIQGNVLEFATTMSMMNASYYTGKATDGKDLKQAQSKAQANKKSILGAKDSIFQLLDEIKKTITSKESKVLFTAIKHLANNSLAIKNALYLNNQPLIDIIDKLISSNIENAFKLDEAQFESLKDIIEDKNLDNIMERVVNAETRADKALGMAVNYYESFKDTALKNETNIQKIIDAFQEQSNSNKEELQNLIIAFTNSNQNLSNINKEIRKDNENKIVEAKLKLMIEGINQATIDSLIKFSNINLDKLNENAQSLTTFFQALKIISNTKLDSGNILKSFVIFNSILSSLVASIPLLSIVNKSFSSEDSSKRIYLEKIGELLIDFDFVFGTINDVRNITKGKELLKSFIYFNLINFSLANSMKSMNKVNERVSKNDLQKLSKNLGTLYFLVGNNLFTTVNRMKPIGNGKEIYKSFNIFKKLNKQLIEIVKNIGEYDQKDLNEGKLRAIGASLSNMSIIMDIINKMKGLDGKARQKIATIAGFFGESKGKGGKKINESLLHIFRSINRMVIPDTKTLNGISNSVNDIKNIIDNLNSINDISKDADKIGENLDKYLKVLEESYKKIQEKFKQIIATSNTADKVKSANEKIASAMESTNETIVKTSSNEKNIKKSVIAIEGMTEFMIGATFVMSIGALIMMLGGGKFVKAALKFGITLMVFEISVLMPALMFANQENAALKGIEGLNKFVVTCSIVMLVGALFMMLDGGKMVKNALTFGVTLMVFELLVIAPFLLFKTKKDEVINSVEGFARFIVTCTIIMLIGGLIVQLSGGKILQNAFQFGIALMEFELLVVAPFLLFSLMKKDISESVKSFTSFLITTTIIFFIGAAVMALSGGKMVKYAMKFAFTLMKFEAMIIAPFLLLNLLRKDVFDGLKAFGTVVMVCTITLLVGALFMKNPELPKAAMLFTALLMAFEAMVIAPFLLFTLIDRQIMKGLRDFALVVFVCTTVLLIGAVFMTMDGGKMPEAAWEFTQLLLKFEVAMVIPMLLFGEISGQALNSAKDFGIFIICCAGALILGAWFIAEYGVEPVEQFGLILGIFVGATTAAMLIFSRYSKYIINDAQQFGIFVLCCSAALVIGALFVAKYGIEPALAFAKLLLGFVTLMSAVMVGISFGFKAAGGDVKVIAQMEALGIFLLMATGSIALGAFIIDKYGMEKPLKYAGLLLLFVVGVSLVFAALSIPPLGPLLLVGIATAALLGVALLTLTGSLMLVNLLFEFDPGGKKLEKNIGVLETILKGGIADVMADLGWLIIPMTLAFVSATELGLILVILSGSLALVHLCIGDNRDSLKKDVDALTEVMLSVGLLTAELILLMIPLGLGVIAAGLLMTFSTEISLSTLMIAEAVKSMSNIGDITKQTEQIANNLTAFVEIPEKVKLGGVLGVFRKITKIGLISSMVMPMSLAMKTVATSVADLASLKVAIAWDKDGNPINYRNLKQQDFDLATNNVGKLLYTMADAFWKTWEGGAKDDQGNELKGLKEFFERGGDGYDAIHNVTKFGIDVGEVLKGVAGGLAAMAKLQVPIAWDEKGNPISFRQLKKEDFELATEGTSLILTNMANTFVKLWGNDINIDSKLGKVHIEKGLSSFIEDEDSPFLLMIQFSKDIGSVLSGMAAGVGAIAKMQIPTAWDEKGNPISFRTLKDNDFTNAAANVSLILTNVIGTMKDLYTKGNTKEFGSDGNINIFDSGTSFFGDNTPPVMRVIEASMKMSEMIGNLGEGIQKMATLQIPIDWDPSTGKPIDYQKLTTQDFKDAGESVKEILTCVIGAITSNEKLMDDAEDVKEALEAIQPISQLIGGMAEGIVHLAAAQVPIRWDPKTGNPIDYQRLTKADLTNAGQAVADIVSCITTALIKAYKEGTPKEPSMESIFAGDTFKNIVEAVSGVGDLISNIADSIIKLGQALVPDDWDENGKATHYTEIDIDKAKLALQDVVRDILGATIDAVIAAYNGPKGDGTGGIKELIGDNENSPFNLAVKGIEGITKIVANITDSVIKMGSAIIPDVAKGVDENGKWKGYKQLDPKEAVKKIKEVFQGPHNNDGILTVLCGVIKTVASQYFDPTNEKNNISGAIANVTGGMKRIIEIVSSSTELLVNISSMTIPSDIDKDGNPTGLHLIEVEDINKAQTNITNILTSLLSIFNPANDGDLQQYLKNGTIIKTGPITQNLSNVGAILSVLTSQIESINQSNEQISKLFKAQSFSQPNKIQDENAKKITIGAIRDLYILINDFVILNKAISGIQLSTTNQDTEKNLKEIQKNIGQLTSAIGTIISSVGAMITAINTAGGIDKVFKFVNNTDLGGSIQKIISSLNSVIYNLRQNTIKVGDQVINNYLIQKSDDENNLQQIRINLANAKSVLISLIDNYTECYNKIKDLQFNEDAMKTKFLGITGFYVQALDFIVNTNSELAKKTGNISNDIFNLDEYIKTVVSPFGDEVFNKFNNLNTSINEIYQSLSQQKDQSKAFKSNTNALQTYITAINTVDIKKVSALSSLVNGLNKLAGQLGNLDRLTETISNDLAEVLKDLVDSLIEAKETIHDAHELQAERAKQIEQSISKVRTIMNSPLNVTIQSATSDPTNLTPGDPENKDSNNQQISSTNIKTEDKSTATDGKKKDSNKPTRGEVGTGKTTKKTK